MLQYLPNALTTLRLLLALPVGLLILRGEYGLALTVAFLAGITDALDGFFARRLNSFSRFGAALDPIADKTLMTTIFFCLAGMGLVPWWLAITVLVRDLVIVGGACCYHWLIGPLEFQPTRVSKWNMAVQVCFCVLMLTAQVLPWIPERITDAFIMLVLGLAVASGLDYVVSWTQKARQDHPGRSAR